MYTLLETDYKIIKGKENFDYNVTRDLFTEYFLEFDYVFGDYSYGKLRLKGFYDSDNKKVRQINDICILDSYIAEYCAPGSKTFLLKKYEK